MTLRYWLPPLTYLFAQSSPRNTQLTSPQLHKASKMWVKVRMMAGGRQCQIDGLSKLTKIEELRKRVQQELEKTDGELEPSKQRLFFAGKVRLGKLCDVCACLNGWWRFMTYRLPRFCFL